MCMASKLSTQSFPQRRIRKWRTMTRPRLRPRLLCSQQSSTEAGRHTLEILAIFLKNLALMDDCVVVGWLVGWLIGGFD